MKDIDATPILIISDTPGGNYVRKARALIGCLAQLAPDLPPGSHISIKHDDWCRIFREQPCNCDADVALVSPTDGPG